jgi:hypothetical protein
MEAIYKDRNVLRTWKWDAIGIYFICISQRHLMLELNYLINIFQIML